MSLNNRSELTKERERIIEKALLTSEGREALRLALLQPISTPGYLEYQIAEGIQRFKDKPEFLEYLQQLQVLHNVEVKTMKDMRADLDLQRLSSRCNSGKLNDNGSQEEN